MLLAHHLPKNCSAITLNQGDQSSPDDGSIISFSSACVTYFMSLTSSGFGLAVVVVVAVLASALEVVVRGVGRGRGRRVCVRGCDKDSNEQLHTSTLCQRILLVSIRRRQQRTGRRRGGGQCLFPPSLSTYLASTFALINKM